MKNKKTLILTIIAVAAVLGIAALIFGKGSTADDIEKNIEATSIKAGYSLEVVGTGSYTGPYVEDGSNVEVSDVLMIKVKNRGKKAVQYGEITLFNGEEKAGVFKFSTLMPGETMVVLESGKAKCDEDGEYKNAKSSNVAYFQTEPKLYDDSLEIQSLDGGLNITNISDKDINGDIMIYFKNWKEDQLLGGITYRGCIEGGLKAGEIRQIMSSNFTQENTKVMFITIDGK